MEELVKKRRKKKNPLKLRFFLFFLMVHHSEQILPPAQYMAVQKIKQQMSLPEEVSSWSDSTDFCNTDPIPILTLVCYEDNITQLHLNGNNTFFPKFPRDISISALFSNLDALPNLKVLTLVSLGLRGPLPSTVGLLSSLEIMNLSSNSFSGTLPMEMASLKSLQTLVLDNNMFTGQIPDWLASLPSLTVLSLKNNSFSGFLPKSLSGVKPLRTLVLSANNLCGNLPNFSNLTNLQVLDVEGNGFGPNFPILPIKLVSLVLKNNRFGLGIPDEVKSCYMLTKIDVSCNEFVGAFPPFLLSMPSIEYLDISGNKLTGKLSRNMSCGSSQLSYVALSSNRLTGELPDCLRNERTTVLCSGNCLSDGEQQWQHRYAFCHNEALAVRIVPAKHEKKKGNAAIVGGVVGGVGLLGLAIFFVKMRFPEKKANKKPRVRQIMETVSVADTLKLLNDARYISETRKLGLLGIPPYRAFTLDELKEATDNFDASNIIGEGSCGHLYKGILTDGTTVAIRALKVRKKRHGAQHYIHQLELLSKIRHCHLVSAIGHCFECDQDDPSVFQIFLVFEFVPNGTLREAVSDGNIGQKKFSWSQRMTAALGIARGIQFLHTGIVGGIFSNQLKIIDILLDHNNNVKISKYNLPLLAENKCEESLGASSSGGRENAIAERLESEDDDDAYCFGVLLLELIMGRKIKTSNDIEVCKDLLHVSLAADELARRNIVDPSVSKECSDHSLKTMIELCIRCVLKDMSSRPSVEDIIWNLQFAAQVQESQSTQSSPRGSHAVKAQNLCQSLE